MKIVAYSKSALEALRGMQPKTAKRIRARIDAYAAGDVTDVKRLAGRDGYRLRVGDWRVLFDDDGHVVAILHIRPRGEAYKGS